MGAEGWERCLFRDMDAPAQLVRLFTQNRVQCGHLAHQSLANSSKYQSSTHAFAKAEMMVKQ